MKMTREKLYGKYPKLYKDLIRIIHDVLIPWKHQCGPGANNKLMLKRVWERFNKIHRIYWKTFNKEYTDLVLDIAFDHLLHKVRDDWFWYDYMLRLEWKLVKIKESDTGGLG